MRKQEDAYVTLFGQGGGEYIEKRSRFVGFCAPTGDEDAALAAVAAQREQHPAANHIIYAYYLRHNHICRYTDGGEPQGTAGLPVLEILRRGGIADAVITVARYFGGTLLGAGNLARAYAEAAKRAVESAGLAAMEPRAVYEITCSYSDYDRLGKVLAALGAETANSVFAETVTVTAAISPARAQELAAGLQEITRGQGGLKFIGDRYQKIKL